MRISELEVNGQYTIDLALISASARKTKAGKDYLFLELSDGVDTIKGNYWDWSSGKIPANNTVLNIDCTCTTWAGNKQLTVQGMRISDKSITDFAPQGPYDIKGIYSEAYSMLSDVNDDMLRQLALSLLEDNSLKQRWLTIPGAKTIHHNFAGGTLVHCYSTAKIAKAIAENTTGANVDLCTVGAFLHDIGKLFTYKLDGAAIGKTPRGMLLEHVYIGAEFISNYADNLFDTDNVSVAYKLDLLKHIILSHHGRLEYGCPVTPMCLEAHIISCADGIDACSETLRAESTKAVNTSDYPWTSKIFSQDNLQHIAIPTMENEIVTVDEIAGLEQWS